MNTEAFNQAQEPQERPVDNVASRSTEQPSSSSAVGELSVEERAELEYLREQARLQKEQEASARQRAELEELRRVAQERKVREREQEELQNIKEIRQRNAKMMDPDEDLRMSPVQRIIVAVLVLAVLATIYYFVSH